MIAYQRVVAVSKAILNVLAEARTSSEFEDAACSLYRVDDFRSPMKYGVSLYLYRVTVNKESRNAPRRQESMEQSSLALNLHYMLTAWGIDAISEHKLLFWAMDVLAGKPIFSGDELNLEQADLFTRDEAVELLIDDLPLPEIISLWTALQHPYRLSIPYITRQVNSI